MALQIKAVVLPPEKGQECCPETNQMPKVLRQACGKPLLHYVLEGLSFVPVQGHHFGRWLPPGHGAGRISRLSCLRSGAPAGNRPRRPVPRRSS